MCVYVVGATFYHKTLRIFCNAGTEMLYSSHFCLFGTLTCLSLVSFSILRLRCLSALAVCCLFRNGCLFIHRFEADWYYVHKHSECNTYSWHQITDQLNNTCISWHRIDHHSNFTQIAVPTYLHTYIHTYIRVRLAKYITTNRSEI